MGVLTKTNLIIVLLFGIFIVLARILYLPHSLSLSQHTTIPSLTSLTSLTSSSLPRREGRVKGSAGRNYEENLLVLYNRIPKTGSTSFMSVMYNLQESNRFSVAYVNVSSSSHRFTWRDAYKFALNISHWETRKPALYHGHFPFLDFTRFGLGQPMYINVVRDPLERFISHYYFVRYGDTYLPNKVRKYQGDTKTFDDCVHDGDSACDAKRLWVQVPYFCGSSPECWEPASKRALQKAKANVAERYFLVGITDEIDKFVKLLEESIPRMFAGSREMFSKDGGVWIRKTKVKKPVEKSTLEHFKKSKVWQMENEFYNFVRKRFEYVYKSYASSKGRYQVNYIKVKP